MINVINLMVSFRLKIFTSSWNLPDYFTGIVEYSNGVKIWYLNGLRHRTDGPAVEDVDRSKEWHLNGLLHREDGPAVEWSDGTKYWYVDDKLHRTDGPAIEYPDGTKYWCLYDISYSEEKWKKEIENLIKK